MFVIVALGVTNTLLMAVMERRREFGMQLALGTEPEQIVRTVLYESLVLGVVGLGAGLLLGAAVVDYFHRFGFDLTAYASGVKSLPGMTGVVYPTLQATEIWLPVIALFLTNVTAALYPAWRAARVEPTSALRAAWATSATRCGTCERGRVADGTVRFRMPSVYHCSPRGRLCVTPVNIRRLLIALSVTCLLVAACSKKEPPPGAVATAPAPMQLDPLISVESVAAGARLYMENCAICHGPEAQGHPDWGNPKVPAAAPPLNGTGKEWKRSKREMIAFVKQGVKKDGVPVMPAWDDRLKDKEIEEIISWFQALWPPDVYARWQKANSAMPPPKG